MGHPKEPSAGDQRPGTERTPGPRPGGLAGGGTRTVVVGVGNEVLGDDGVGLAAARRVAARARGRASHREVTGSPLDLLDAVTGFDRAVILDACRSLEAPPGTTLRLGPWALPPGTGYRSLHTLPLADLLHLGRVLGRSMPGEVVVHVLCVRDIDRFRTGFTAPVEARWRRWADEVYETEFGPSRPERAPASPVPWFRTET